MSVWLEKGPGWLGLSLGAQLKKFPCPIESSNSWKTTPGVGSHRCQANWSGAPAKTQLSKGIPQKFCGALRQNPYPGLRPCIPPEGVWEGVGGSGAGPTHPSPGGLEEGGEVSELS